MNMETRRCESCRDKQGTLTRTTEQQRNAERNGELQNILVTHNAKRFTLQAEIMSGEIARDPCFRK